MSEAEHDPSDALLSAQRRLRILRDLEASPGWREELLPHIEESLGYHRSELARPGYAERAEHVHAVHVLAALPNYLPHQIGSLHREIADMLTKGGFSPDSPESLEESDLA